MRRAFRRAGWALAAAGGIGIAAPALGQSPAVRILGPDGQVIRTEEIVAMTESEARLEESQVELAFLADPMLFSYGLASHVEANTLEVRGFVPTAAVREEAMRVAKERSGLTVIDKLKVLPTVSSHNAVDRPENIQRAARELLADAIPEFGKGMNVRCDARGHVTVMGHVGSQEDKVLVSRKLRQVPGCSCVVNELSVGEVRHDVPPRDKGPLVFPEAPPVTVKPAVRPREASAPALPARPVVATPVLRESLPPSESLPRAYSGPGALPLVPTPAEKPLPEVPVPPMRMVAPPPAVDVPTPPAKPETRKPASSIDKDRTYASVPPAGPSLEVPPLIVTKPAPAVKLPVIVTQPSAPARTPPPLPPIPSPPKAPAVEKHHGGGSEESDVTEGVITFGDEVPAPARPTGSAMRPTSSYPVKPAEGTLTLTPPPMPPSRSASAPLALAAPAAKPPIPPAPAAPQRPTVGPALRLQERIQSVCGPAYDVRVTATSDNAWHLEVTGSKAGEENRLADRIRPVLESPEFSWMEVNWDLVLPAEIVLPKK